ncbi:MAG: hypothetical protein LCH88_11980 [Proteobacteria bacterium]|nr:hypothetical protein [Pseudomonadota bacterium]
MKKLLIAVAILVVAPLIAYGAGYRLLYLPKSASNPTYQVWLMKPQTDMPAIFGPEDVCGVVRNNVRMADAECSRMVENIARSGALFRVALPTFLVAAWEKDRDIEGSDILRRLNRQQ